MIIRLLGLITSVALAAGPSTEKVLVTVNGMVCSFCAQGIEKKFKSRAEVESVEVDLDHKIVDLKFKEGKNLNDGEIIKIIKDSGYDVVSIKKESAQK